MAPITSDTPTLVLGSLSIILLALPAKLAPIYTVLAPAATASSGGKNIPPIPAAVPIAPEIEATGAATFPTTSPTGASTFCRGLVTVETAFEAILTGAVNGVSILPRKPFFFFGGSGGGFSAYYSSLEG